MVRSLFAFFLTAFTFGCIPNDPPAEQGGTHEENWVVYSTLLEGNPAVVAVDLGLRPLLPLAGYDELVRLSLPARQTDPNGFPVDSELKHMIALEEKIETGALNRGALLIGRTTTNGFRNLFFAASDGKDLQKLFKGQLGNGEYQTVVQLDPAWRFYREYLLPNPFEMNQINNERILTKMEEAGDRLEADRPVEHWLYFKTEKGRSQMISLITKEGFTVVDTPATTEKGDSLLPLHIIRTETPERRRMNELTWWLHSRAEEMNGEYDGWETELVRAPVESGGDLQNQ